MKESENSWSEEELLEEMESMQDQIESLQAEKQQMSSEISELRSTLQQSQRKIQEQSAHIVRLNSADLILKDNERLKEEICAAKTETWNVKNSYGKKLDQLEAVRKTAEEKKKKAEDVLAKERSLILSKGKMIADERIKKEKQAHKSRIRCLKEEHRKAILIRDRYIYLALVAITLSVIISLFQRDKYALNWIAGINSVYLTYMLWQWIQFIRQWIERKKSGFG